MVSPQRLIPLAETFLEIPSIINGMPAFKFWTVIPNIEKEARSDFGTIVIIQSAFAVPSTHIFLLPVNTWVSLGKCCETKNGK